jgi:hypothetical protein
VRRAEVAVVLLALLALWPVAGARAADPGRWRQSDARSVPLEYFQGLTHDAAANLYFTGLSKGGYRTTPALHETARSLSLIPPDVEASIGFNHIGDPTHDAAEGGRLLLPLECYTPGKPNGGNTCGRGGIGVADPGTLAWRYWVALDPGDIPKAMWAEVSPDGTLLWTSAGNDLLGYATADITAANAAAGADAAPIHPVVRVAGAVPPSGITGAVFSGGRLLLAGETAGLLQVWAVDVSGATPPSVEIELPGVRAESEGLDLVDAAGGMLHWLLSPFSSNGTPTYGAGHSELLSFVTPAEAALRVGVTPGRLRAGHRTTVTATVRHFYAGRWHRVPGARVAAAGHAAATDAQGVARIRIRPARPGTVSVRATKLALRAARVTLRATR